MKRGFTLLEVMVAVAILGLSLTAIFSSEAGAIRMATRSGKMGMAALLVRCKMGEIEEQVADEGLPAIYASGSDGCCEEAEIDGFSCDWEINPVVLPDAMFAPEEEEGLLDDEEAPEPDPQDGIALPLSAATTDPSEILAGGSVGGLVSTAMSFVYPVLKPSFEAQIRRATVTVRWREGASEKSFDVTQYLVANQGVALDLEGLEQEAQAGQTGPGSSTTPGTPGTPGASPGSGNSPGGPSLLKGLFGR
ncbi:MAG: prepilin-type N-terminal cleavage/methylation domain-containing protein [Myxococcales bacterium]|nr:prepilin-type N-terminal cleavage/methylation domain-containing protein [Myxococcales bacterium]MDD9970327.1 prepilin-type N-terminal cleavage/methylation domain-containing protein [Myxococcales bacterium]